MTESSKKPTHRAFVAKTFTGKDGEEKTHWIAIGSAWPTKDGKGFDVRLDALPIDGRIVIKLDEPKPATA